jgi:hypothetical protein
MCVCVCGGGAPTVRFAPVVPWAKTGPALSLTSALDWVVNVTTRPLYPRERPCTYCTGSWVGPRAGLDA